MFDPGLIATRLGRLSGWPFGSVRIERSRQIGKEHGLSGTVHRVWGRSATGELMTFVVKQDELGGVQRALGFHAAMGERISGSAPTCYGGDADPVRGTGTLFLEDVRPATQGDVLVDPGQDAAESAMRTIARIHAASWRERVVDHDPTLARWEAAGWDAVRWEDRLTRAHARFPAVMTDEVARRLVDLPERVTKAARALADGPASWIHGDAHLDNVLWRPDGRAVLLDWAGARIGPPAVDVARFVVEGPPGLRSGSSRILALIAAYQQQLRDDGLPEEAAARVTGLIDDAALSLAQGVVGWAGRSEAAPLDVRMARLRENALAGVVRWLEMQS